ncbi:splicing factor ESS-2 homolog [Lucilia cuprina]|uniref:splicing factor ESS-2 homolog n=1 Tax=Lucilia cuprina TaxID=7375 RepID=UPI001F05C6DC|nr:splicing factor ESS-2 homolog [Lucilia cuprina]
MSETNETPTPSTPGSGALVNFKTRNHAMETFKKPSSLGIVKKKAKPKILTEEKYIEEISKIIQRDFFPDLEKLKAQNDYLDAMDQKDYARMESIRAKYSGRKPTERNRSMTPDTFETPSSFGERTPRNNEPSETCRSSGAQSVASSSNSTKSSTKSVSDKHSLDSFLQSYTSEDNDSFQKIIDTADEKLRQKFAVLYNEEALSAEKLQRALTLPSIEQQFEEPDPMRKIETWTYQNKNSIMYTPQGVELTEAEKIDMANRKQVIQHHATRLHVNPFEGVQRQKTGEQNAAAIATLGDRVDADGTSLSQTNLASQLKRFDLVKTPSPRPGEAFSPLMTWGEIEGTPFRLDGSDTPVRSNTGPSFKINESSRRETIALALAEKVGEKIRAQKQKAMDTARRNISSPFIRTNMERLASMSPAARQLATSRLGLRTTPSLMTPSPIRTPNLIKGKTKALPTRTASTTKKLIPATSPAVKPKTPNLISNAKSGTLTDDLLQIPTKRLRASDFF